jgi:hypothetical protein
MCRRPRGASVRAEQREGADVNIVWTIVVYVFVVGTVATVTYGLLRLFGRGPRPQH